MSIERLDEVRNIYFKLPNFYCARTSDDSIAAIVSIDNFIEERIKIQETQSRKVGEVFEDRRK